MDDEGDLIVEIRNEVGDEVLDDTSITLHSQLRHKHTPLQLVQVVQVVQLAQTEQWGVLPYFLQSLEMVDDMVQEQMSLLQLLDEMVDPDDEVLDFQHLLVQVVQLHNDLLVVHQIQVDDELDEVDDRVLLVKMGNSPQTLEMVVQVHQIQFQVVQ